MTRLLLVLALVLAGCVSPDVASEAPTPPAAEAASFHAEGRLFLPPSSGSEREETLLAFPVNTTGAAIVVDLALGITYGPLEGPATLSDVVAELRAPDGTVLAEGAMRANGGSVRMEAVANATGDHWLALLSYGGSDGSANGDRVDYVIDVA